MVYLFCSLLTNWNLSYPHCSILTGSELTAAISLHLSSQIKCLCAPQSGCMAPVHSLLLTSPHMSNTTKLMLLFLPVCVFFFHMCVCLFQWLKEGFQQKVFIMKWVKSHLEQFQVKCAILDKLTNIVVVVIGTRHPKHLMPLKVVLWWNKKNWSALFPTFSLYIVNQLRCVYCLRVCFFCTVRKKTSPFKTQMLSLVWCPQGYVLIAVANTFFHIDSMHCITTFK